MVRGAVADQPSDGVPGTDGVAGRGVREQSEAGSVPVRQAAGVSDGGDDRVRFDRTYRLACAVRPVSIKTVDCFLSQHYLHKRPGVCTLVLGLFMNDAVLFGTVVFALPPRETNVRYGGCTWELARLYLADTVPCNAESWAIGRSLRYIRQHHPTVRFIVSYADPSAGHIGTIYKASNFRADGRTDDDRKTPRFDYVDATSGKVYSRRAHVPSCVVIVRKPRVSKFRFVRAL